MKWLADECFDNDIIRALSIGQVIEEVLLLDRYSQQSDWAAGVIYLPLQ